MRKALVLAAVALAAGCNTAPLTRDEFKKGVQSQSMLTLTGSHASSRRFEDAVAMLERKWKECYGFQRTTTRTQGGMTTMNYKDTYHPRVRKVSSSLVEMTLQMTTEGMIMLSKVPEGGDYIVALDVERAAGNKAKLTWYSGSLGGWKAAWERNKQWSDGKDVACDA
jgi:hypothetical protein